MACRFSLRILTRGDPARVATPSRPKRPASRPLRGHRACGAPSRGRSQHVPARAPGKVRSRFPPCQVRGRGRGRWRVETKHGNGIAGLVSRGETK